MAPTILHSSVTTNRSDKEQDVVLDCCFGSGVFCSSLCLLFSWSSSIPFAFVLLVLLEHLHQTLIYQDNHEQDTMHQWLATSPNNYGCGLDVDIFFHLPLFPPVVGNNPLL
jgi:hypothetical protein